AETATEQHKDDRTTACKGRNEFMGLVGDYRPPT
ncbi:MAG: hypothetical protein RLZZ582_1011, partial [Verrucomicrobiota bacterium]